MNDPPLRPGSAIRRNERLWLILPLWLTFAVDVGLTLAGQSDAYWSGRYKDVVEENPLARAILATSPWYFLGLAFSWALILSLSAIPWKHPLVVRVAVLVVVIHTLAHAVGGSSWLIRSGSMGWIMALVYMASVAGFAHACWRRSGLLS